MGDNTGLTIIEAAAAVTRYSKDDICGPSRSRALCNVRFAIIHALRKTRPDLSYPAIGRIIGRRDHSTVMHGWQRSLDLIERYPGFRALVEHLITRAEGLEPEPLPEPVKPDEINSRWWTEEEDQIIRDMFGKFFYTDIGKRLGRPSSTVRRRAEAIGLKSDRDDPPPDKRDIGIRLGTMALAEALAGYGRAA